MYYVCYDYLHLTCSKDTNPSPEEIWIQLRTIQEFKAGGQHQNSQMYQRGYVEGMTNFGMVASFYLLQLKLCVSVSTLDSSPNHFHVCLFL